MRCTAQRKKFLFRFEEQRLNDVEYLYEVSEKSAKITVYPGNAPVKHLKLRFNGELRNEDKVYGDQWERTWVRLA